MILIIVSIILSLITVMSIAGYCLTEEKSLKYSLFGLLWLILILFGCFKFVRANQVGIIYDPFHGGIQDKLLNEGFKAKNPLQKIYKIDTKIQELSFENISIQTNDSQWVNAIIQVQARVGKENAYEYFKKYGKKSLQDISSIISNTTQKQFETITIQYNIMELLGEKRSEIISKTEELVKQELLKDGIIVERVILIDTDAGDNIENAIANEAIKKKEAEAAKYEKEKAQLEGEAKVIEAQKEKEANELKQTTLTQQILQEKMLEKWNEQLPTTVLNDNIMSVFNMNQ